MNLNDFTELYKPKIDIEIRNFLNKKIERVEYDFLADYYTEIQNYLLAGGKRIRPLLCIATYNTFSEFKDETIVIPSLSVEFLHNASLIHDDILDNDDFRRGEPAFHFRFTEYHKKYTLEKMSHREFGRDLGILGGDSTFFLGLDPLIDNHFSPQLNQQAISYYKSVFHELCEGVLMELDFVHQKETSMENYIKMVSLKTGALIEKAMLIGATYAKVSPELIPLISDYAINLGILFQITDDIIGTYGDEEITGKPTDGDIREGKKTALLISALEKLESPDKKQLIALIEQKQMTENDVKTVRSLFSKVDAIKECNQLAKGFYQKAKQSLAKLKPVATGSEFPIFGELLDFVLNRKH